jgi:hypothetical protein
MNLCAGAVADTTWLTAIAPRDFVALAQRWRTLWPAYFPART